MKTKLIVVLGMHRSGTSAIARGMQVFGAELGERLGPAMPDNEKGFWEDQDLMALNNEMLREIGSDWHHVAPITVDDVTQLEARGYLARAGDLISQKVSGNAVFGIKDPRIAKLLPFWKEVFGQLDLDVRYIIVIRNPLSVQRSLAVRNNLDPTISHLLWLGHVFESLRLTEGCHRALVDFDQLLGDCEGQLQALAKQLALQVDPVAMTEYCAAFIDGDLRHSRFEVSDLNEDATCPMLVREVYAALLEVAEGISQLDSGRLQADLAAWHAEFERLSPLLALVDRIGGQVLSEKEQALTKLRQVAAELKLAIAERDGLAAQKEVLFAERDAAVGQRDIAVEQRDIAVEQRDIAVEQRDAAVEQRDTAGGQRDAAVAQIEMMTRSLSWRMTRPLRFAARTVRHGLTPQDRAQLAVRLRSYYHRLPLPSSVRRFLGRIYHRRLVKSFQAARHVLADVRQFSPPTVQPQAPQQGKPDYIFWGVIDWHFRHQRPQHLAETIAKTGRRVFYVSPVLADSAHPGFEVESLDSSGRLFQVRLYAKNPPQIYSDPPGLELSLQLRKGIGEVISWADSMEVVSVVQHPFWHGVASVIPNSRLIYDCMDHHEGFGDFADAMQAQERALLTDADLTVVTSGWLEDAVAPYVDRTAVIRNAGEYDHFSQPRDSVYRDAEGRKVIGYYGAIADWFDAELVEAVARQHPDCSVLLIGADTANVKARLGRLPNVTFLGERPYSELPFYLHGFDVCMLPFKVIPLTLATNPVKAYEYLSAGKPVVTTELPEMRQFGELVYTAGDTQQFLSHVGDLLAKGESPELATRRKELASQQTWVHRVRDLVAAAEDATQDPLVSVVVVTYNNLDLTRDCLASLEAHSQYPNLEIIVVDNASGDDSPAFLREWVAAGEGRRLILNEDNRGFAAANNQGLEAASGDYLVMLNNDTYVTPGWVRTLVGHLRRDATIGMVGPVTNNIGNEAKIDIAYQGMADMLVRAAAYTRRRIGQTYPLRTAAFFCVMMPRSTYERVGSLDESFGRGFFEDDDYCRRVEQLGLRIVCAEDVFIHHHLSASFDKLKQSERRRLFDENKKLYEQKWGEWIPHGYRSCTEEAASFSTAPSGFESQQSLAGTCNVCGKPTHFFYADAKLWRESLNCEHCRTTSRYRSVARGILRALDERGGVQASSLATLPHLENRRLEIYDTQPPFYYETCAYPLPDLLRNSGWITVALSQYKPKQPLGKRLAEGITNQNLECLTFEDESLDVVITSDVMEHVRLDDRAHEEIFRVLKPGGIYVFTVPHDRSWDKTLVRVEVVDPDDPAKDVHLLEPEYHGDTNSDDGKGVLAYRTYGRDLEDFLTQLGFEVDYCRDDMPQLGIMNTELFYCRKLAPERG